MNTVRKFLGALLLISFLLYTVQIGRAQRKSTTNAAKSKTTQRSNRVRKSRPGELLITSPASMRTIRERRPLDDRGVGPEIIVANENNAPMDQTCQYIVNRISEYSGQAEYAAEEYNEKVLITPDEHKRYFLSWTSHHPVTGIRNVRLPLNDLNTSKISTDHGVIWIRTRGKSITVQTERETYYEDEWWIDTHDDQVAHSIARALIHAGQLCNPDNVKDPFTK
jgi:hypothetical protein